MKRTGPTKESTRALIVELEKRGKANKEDVWGEIARRLGTSTRARIRVNLWKISALAEKKNFKGKIIVVPGKVLGTGDINGAVNISAFEFSESAKKKIEAAKGKALTLRALLDAKPKKSELMIAR
ncbi:MAG: 50S ribosomal protein L18e [Candidatus Diapherotrites archaeon]